MIQSISPLEAKRLFDEEGARLIDIREPEEYAHEHIEGAHLMPLSVFTLLPPASDRERTAIFYCRSGTRTRGSAEILEIHGFADTYYIEGGLMGWEKAGLPIVRRKTPMPMSRQILMAAGTIIFILSLCAFFMPVFTWLTLFVGANLLFAGYSGICLMANLLIHMPWNKATPD